MQMIIDHARAEGLATVEGQVLRENTAMLAMCRELGFKVTTDPDDAGICVVKLKVDAGAA
jgi:acetyltransferase